MAGGDVQILSMMSLMHGQDKTETLNHVHSAKLRLGSMMAVITSHAKNVGTNGVGYALANTKSQVVIVEVKNFYLVQEASLDMKLLARSYLR